MVPLLLKACYMLGVCLFPPFVQAVGRKLRRSFIAFFLVHVLQQYGELRVSRGALPN